VIVAGLRRLAAVVGSLGLVVVTLSVVVGLLTGTALSRAVSLGLIFLGSFMFVAGAAVGLRGPARPNRRPDGVFERWALESPAQRVEAINVSYLLVAVGLFFVLVGVVLDPRAQLL